MGYDPNGNLTSDAGGAANVANSWNYRNELTNTAIGQTSVSYGYDPSGQRISLREQTGSAVTTTDFPTSSYSKTVKPDGTVERIVSIEAAGLPVATIRTRNTDAPEVFVTHTDHLRSTRLVITEGAGLGAVNIVEQTDYDPFGKITRHEQTGDFAEKKKFTSHEFDASTSYTYAKARYLDTEAGRFASQDPKFINNPEELLSDPQQLNSYSYARNNPIKYVDPDGESATLIGAVAGGIIGGGTAIWNGGNWKDIASGVVTGATVGAIAGSVIDTGGLSLPAVAGVLKISGAAEFGVDAIDFGIKNYISPDKFSSEEKKNAGKEVIKDIAEFGISKSLTKTGAAGFDILTTTMDKLDEYFGEEIYKNVNEKYQQSSGNTGRSQISSSPGVSVSGVNVGSNYSSIQQQLDQIKATLQQVRHRINNP